MSFDTLQPTEYTKQPPLASSYIQVLLQLLRDPAEIAASHRRIRRDRAPR